MLKIFDELSVKYHWIAYVYATLGCLFLVLMQWNSKYLVSLMSPFDVMILRGTFLFLINSYVLHQNSIDLNQKDPKSIL